MHRLGTGNFQGFPGVTGHPLIVIDIFVVNAWIGPIHNSHVSNKILSYKTDEIYALVKLHDLLRRITKKVPTF